MVVFIYLSKYAEFLLKPLIISLLIMFIIKIITLKVVKKPLSFKGSYGKVTGLLIMLSVIGLSGMIITEQMPLEPLTTLKNIVTTGSNICIIVLSLGFAYIFINHASRFILKIKRFLWSQAIIIFLTYIVVFLFLLSCQESFITKNSLFFQPTKISEETAKSYIDNNTELIYIATPDNVKLQGWFINNAGTFEKAPLVIYFGGSGREVSYMVNIVRNFKGFAVVLVNYRGYGLSEGTPTEENIIKDASFVYDYYSEREDIDKDNIISMGWSLGANVAAILSGSRDTTGTILIAPSDSETHWFQKVSFPYIPLWVFRKNFFDAITIAPKINTPVLCLVGENDDNNPPELAEHLMQEWKGQKTIRVYENEDHQLLFHDNTSIADIRKFIGDLKNR